MVHIFIFEEVWRRDPRCENFVNQLWNNHTTRDHNKFVTMQCLEELFQECKIGTINKKLRRIKSLLNDEDK